MEFLPRFRIGNKDKQLMKKSETMQGNQREALHEEPYAVSGLTFLRVWLPAIFVNKHAQDERSGHHQGSQETGHELCLEGRNYTESHMSRQHKFTWLQRSSCYIDLT